MSKGKTGMHKNCAWKVKYFFKRKDSLVGGSGGIVIRFGNCTNGFLLENRNSIDVFLGCTINDNITV